MVSLRVSPAHRLVVAAGGEWFQVDDGDLIRLDTRISYRKLLIALAEQRMTKPDAAMSVAGAFEAGWPEDRVSAAAASMRVYTAIHSLRRLGLRGVLVRRNRGYLLEAQVHIAREESPSSTRMQSGATEIVHAEPVLAEAV